MPDYLRSLLYQVAGKMKKAIANSVNERRRIDVEILESPILVFIMLAYYSLYIAGAIWTLLMPESTAGKWRI